MNEPKHGRRKLILTVTYNQISYAMPCTQYTEYHHVMVFYITCVADFKFDSLLIDKAYLSKRGNMGIATAIPEPSRQEVNDIISALNPFR
uniref:Uncharacterized protein n=1 Tax=Glossina palpalis gambiensis TaxID=67801 RepID=A0A1B0C260_9MUSC